VLSAGLVFALVSLGAASASGLPVGGAVVQSGAEADLRCDEGGVTVSYATSGANVTHSTISGIDAHCFGATMNVTWDVEPGLDQTLSTTLATTSSLKMFEPPILISALAGVTVVIYGHDAEIPNLNDP